MSAIGDQKTTDGIPMSATPSLDSSITHVQAAEKAPVHVNSDSPNISLARGESQALEDKFEKTLEDDWENDPENARNWSSRKKWTAVCIVRRPYPFVRSHELMISRLLILQISAYTFVTPLASSMMAPGIPEVAMKYGITNSTIIALTLSIFLLSFAFGVNSRLLV